MDRVSGIKNSYIQVKDGDKCSFGGSQMYYKDKIGKKNTYKHLNGCGIVALADLMTYLADSRGRRLRIKGRTITKEFDSIGAYMEYYDDIVRATGWLPSPLGVSSFWLALWFNVLCVRFRLPYVGFWGCRRGPIFSRVNEMLKADVPVILCVPHVLNPFRKKTAKIKMYVMGSELKSYNEVSSHFVTVTGISQHHGRTFYEVASWGKRYEIDIREFDSLCKSLLLGNILGNVLVVKKLGR